MYEKILVPTDGSEGAEVAIDHAVELAEKFDAEIHVVYVVDLRAGSSGDVVSVLVGTFEEIGDKATRGIAELLEKKDLEAVTEVTRGIPHAEINNYADENGIDLIVMGTHGRTGIDRMLVGSTAEKVVRTSKIPVMMVRRRD